MTTTSPAATDEPADGADPVAGVEQGFARLFHRMRATWKRAALDVHPDLQPMGYKVLSTIARRGTATASELVEELQADKSVLSRQVRQLEELGLVVSRPDPRDGRVRLLEPTPAAVERVAAIRARTQAELRERLATWTPDEVRLFADLLSRLGE